jgi:hypothetical protein
MKICRLKLLQLLRAAILLGSVSAPSLCSAYVECALTPSAMYMDSGTLWVNFSNGGAGVVAASDTAQKYYYATMTTALVTGRSVAVRYADGTACTAFNVQMIGLWLK